MGRLNIKEKTPQNTSFMNVQNWTAGLHRASLWAQRGFGYLSTFAWVLATGAVVLYLPILRALDSDRELIKAIKVH